MGPWRTGYYCVSSRCRFWRPCATGGRFLPRDETAEIYGAVLMAFIAQVTGKPEIAIKPWTHSSFDETETRTQFSEAVAALWHSPPVSDEVLDAFCEINRKRHAFNPRLQVPLTWRILTTQPSAEPKPEIEMTFSAIGTDRLHNEGLVQFGYRRGPGGADCFAVLRRESSAWRVASFNCPRIY